MITRTDKILVVYEKRKITCLNVRKYKNRNKTLGAAPRSVALLQKISNNLQDSTDRSIDKQILDTDHTADG